MIKGRILKGIAGFYYIHVEGRGTYECKAKGIFRNQKIKPLVGDDVEIEILSEEEKTGNLVEIFPRSSELIRPAVANVDQALVIFAAAKPKPNLSLLDRFLIMMDRQEVHTVICFNKMDEASEAELQRLGEIYAGCGSRVLFTCARKNEGVQELKHLLLGHTTTVAGPSGVGKSTLINRLLGEKRLATDGLRNDDKGHHTTTHRELLVLPNGAMVIDTPGMRELGMWDAASGVGQTFGDIEELAARCRFRNCSHSGEPGCAVRAAIRSGELDSGRWQSYQKLKNENSYAADSESYLAAKEKKFKEISKINKYNKKR